MNLNNYRLILSIRLIDWYAPCSMPVVVVKKERWNNICFEMSWAQPKTAKIRKNNIWIKEKEKKDIMLRKEEIDATLHIFSFEFTNVTFIYFCIHKLHCANSFRSFVFVSFCFLSWRVNFCEWCTMIFVVFCIHCYCFSLLEFWALTSDNHVIILLFLWLL